MSTIYRARGIGKAFGTTVALKDVSFDVSKGAIVGLVGMNGAGKSTLLRIIAGAIRPDTGELTLGGREVQFGSAMAALEQGIALVSQELSLFPDLSVEENLKIFSFGSTTRLRGSAFRDKARRMLESLGFTHPLRQRVSTLGLADRQLIEIARALLHEPRILILDEPTSALHASEVERLHAQILRLRDNGVGIVYVSHFLEDLLSVCDEVVILRDGRRIETPELKGPQGLDRLVQAMVGGTAKTVEAPERLPRKVATGSGRPLAIRDLRGPSQLFIRELDVQQGEILGLAGVVGSGVEEFFSVMFGFARPRSGQVSLPSGVSLPRSTSGFVHAGVALAPSDRKAVGLMIRQSIGENVVSVSNVVQAKFGLFPRKSTLNALSQKWVKAVGVKFETIDQAVSTLSGGNQQKVVFAKWLASGPTLLLLDDPTRGIDVNARKEIHRVIRDLAMGGMTIVFYSSDTSETVDIAHRTAIFVDGELVETLSGEDMTEHNVVTRMNMGGPQAAAVMELEAR